LTTPTERRTEPLAIIGIGCRFPGSDSPEEFWDLLREGTDAIIDVPADRWDVRRFQDSDPAMPGRTLIAQAGFLRHRIDEFDALFFGISPREAACLDPQQRFLLEVTWEALEDAGVPAETLAGSDAGVYIGGFTLDSLLLHARSGVFVPVEIARVTCHEPLRPRVWAHARLKSCTSEAIEGDIALCGEDGTVLAEIRGLHCRSLGNGNAARASPPSRGGVRSTCPPGPHRRGDRVP
jgi:hypothetical protein